MMADLENLGFRPIVRILSRNGRLAPESFTWEDSSGWLYAFVCGGDVMYVGMTINVLRSRLDGYRYGADQEERIRNLIFAELKKEREVWLYGLPVPDQDSLITEEARLRREYQIPWNRI